MDIRFLGAAQTVTGSCYVIETAGKRFAVDCGMHQGNATIEKRNFSTAPYKADALDFILLTHAHIDHSGLLPRMCKEGFTGPVYCTEPTVDLLNIMLLDSAHIQEMEAEWANRKYARGGRASVDALYATDDAVAAARRLSPLRYGEWIKPAPGIAARFYDAGHILGSSFLELEINGDANRTRLVFSGDLGRPDSLIVEDPARPDMEPVDYLFLESTYGDRDHKNEGGSRDELAEAINHSIANGQKTIIPAFAVERTQEIIYSLFLLQKEGKIPGNLPVYVDSPMAIRATEVFRRHQSYFDSAARNLVRAGEDPLSLPGLKYTLDVKDSQAINLQEGPAVVISASGMCNAGRIKHHLRHNLWRKGASIVFVGFQAVGTPGRKIVDGAKNITMLGDDVEVAAKIWTIGGFSGHAGQQQLLDWTAHFAHPELKVFLVHGEEKAQHILAGLLRERFELEVGIPHYLETLTLQPGKAPRVSLDAQDAAIGDLVPRNINWNVLLEDSEAKLAQLRAALAAPSGRPWADQMEIQERILEINKRMLQIVAGL
ncbi:MAG: MBL fold metallo-hydrolase [Desulfovibrio sp.]|nr:MBL fold metallo-hydrolase [Desulfovibrio sp.]